jgi:hypothetical protein
MRPAVLTQHNDNSRSGSNLQETALNVANVNFAKFGSLPHLDMNVDGHVYAQPLFVPDVSVPGRGKHDVLLRGDDEECRVCVRWKFGGADLEA